MALTQADFQQLSSTGGAQAVFDAAKNAGMSLEQLAQVGGVSTQEMANLAQSQGISTEQLGQIGWSSPAPVAAPTPPAAGTPAIAGKTGQMDVLTGQFKYYGTPEYDSWLKGITPELNAYGIAPSDYLKGGVGATMMNNPLVANYSSDFAANNEGRGGGQAWAQGQGGLLGYARNQGYTDAQGYSTGLGNELSGGLNNNFRTYMNAQGGKAAPGGVPTAPVQGGQPYRPPQQGYQQPSYQQPSYQQQPGYSPYGNYRGFSGGYGRYGGYGQQSMYPYQNYGRQGMFGGTATSRQPYTGYQAYQPYGGNYRNGMFGAPTMNYNMRNRPMQQYSQSWSQNNPYSFGGY